MSRHSVPGSTPAITAVDLVKTYPGRRGKPPVKALDGLSFGAAAGSVFGLLGPNGAGKSTAVKILSTLSRADSGIAEVAGIDVARHPEKVRASIGFVAQKSVCDPMDTGYENLVLAGRLQGLAGSEAKTRARELLARSALTEAKDRLVKTYSGGMARRLDVAVGLVHRPAVLFLDEPTTGLDPEARADMWDEIESMASAESMTVLLTTHYLDEADRLAAEVAILDGGRILASGSPDELKRELRGDAVIIGVALDADPARARGVLERIPSIWEVSCDARIIRARTDDGAAALPQALAALDAAGVAVASATLARPSLDDVYLRHTGRAYSAADAQEVAA
ncbi:ATP-binding cassette domain-containing protein [Sinomonas sp. JGH33]|uniref:ATP-binding cassette domain-containing protein n=1 Tax=Sinomonas terricola TaxID=3110330 RepID=A0ABU5T7B2_9MICC|nr:ATP-binding cassette domain-containing protein [Sinomonas sp. JGH33]MEA5455565.1 ATP-binding cassette domain-containing protein [Sinomonas sp. JGH33]